MKAHGLRVALVALKSALIVILCTVILPITAPASQVCSDMFKKASLETYANRLNAVQMHQAEALVELGYDASIAVRFVLHKPYFAENLIQGKIHPITVYRGIKTSLAEYDPAFKDGISSRTGRLWVSQMTSTAEGFAEGLMLKLQIPENFGSQRVWQVENVTIERMYLSRSTEVRDDREFLLDIFIPSEKKWFTYDEAVQNGWIQPL